MLVNKKQLADIFGVTERSVTDWQAEGLPISNIGGKGLSNTYETKDCIAWIVTRERLKVRSKVAGASEDDAAAGLDIERERKLKLEADLLQLKLDEQKGTLIQVEDARTAWSDLVASFRARILSMPAKLAYTLTAAVEAKEIEKILRDECYEALTELSRSPSYEKDKDVEQLNA